MTELRQRHTAAESSAGSQGPVHVDEPIDWKKDKEDTLSYGKTPDGKGKREQQGQTCPSDNN